MKNDGGLGRRTFLASLTGAFTLSRFKKQRDGSEQERWRVRWTTETIPSWLDAVEPSKYPRIQRLQEKLALLLKTGAAIIGVREAANSLSIVACERAFDTFKEADEYKRKLLTRECEEAGCIEVEVFRA